jgi:serine protease Do
MIRKPNFYYLIKSSGPTFLILLGLIFFCGTCSAVEGSSLRRTAIVQAIQQSRPTIVSIQGEKTVVEQEGTEEHTAGRAVNGTGVIIDRRGYIITNFHVINGVEEIRVTLDNGSRYTAEMIARDKETDLALVKIDCPEHLPVISLGVSSDLMTGEPVIAIGNAYGYEQSVTRGIISSLHRAVQISDAQFYADLIQTDASINPGNSGGPLLNIDGDMIGINVAVRVGAQGIGFAIPVDKVLEVSSRLLNDHNAKKIVCGLDLNLDADNKTLVVKSIEKGSPAEEAGIQIGDHLIELDAVRMERLLDYHCGLLERRPGETVQLKIDRNGDPMQFDLALAKMAPKKKLPPMSTWHLLGLKLKQLSQKEFRNYYNSKSSIEGGLVVVSVRQDGPAAKLGIQKGDILVGMHVWQTRSLDNLSWILNRSNLTSHNPIRLTIIRNNEMMDGRMSIALDNSKVRR